MSRLIIGMDVDNVIYPYSTVMARWVERRKGLVTGTLDDIALSWEWYLSQWGITHEEFMDHFRAGVNAGYVFGEGCPVEGSVSTLRRLSNAGHQITYVTDRAIPGVDEHLVYDLTVDWLNRNGFPDGYGVIITGNKSQVPTSVFLDDKPANVEGLLAAGHPFPLLWDRPHNRSFTTLDGRRAIVRPGRAFPLRIHDWHGFERVVETIAAETERGTIAA